MVGFAAPQFLLPVRRSDGHKALTAKRNDRAVRIAAVHEDGGIFRHDGGLQDGENRMRLCCTTPFSHRSRDGLPGRNRWFRCGKARHEGTSKPALLVARL